MSLTNDLNNFTLNEKKFIHYKFLLDKTYHKLNELIHYNKSDKSKINKLTSKLETLLLITNNYHLIINNKYKSS
jgi:hypothetical protein